MFFTPTNTTYHAKIDNVDGAVLLSSLQLPNQYILKTKDGFFMFRNFDFKTAAPYKGYVQHLYLSPWYTHLGLKNMPPAVFFDSDYGSKQVHQLTKNERVQFGLDLNQAV